MNIQSLPALEHGVIKQWRAVRRLLKPTPFIDQLNYLIPFHTLCNTSQASY